MKNFSFSFYRQNSWNSANFTLPLVPLQSFLNIWCNLGQKYSALQVDSMHVQPSWESNSWPPYQHSTFNITKVPALTSWPSVTREPGYIVPPRIKITTSTNCRFLGNGTPLSCWIILISSPEKRGIQCHPVTNFGLKFCLKFQEFYEFQIYLKHYSWFTAAFSSYWIILIFL